LSKNTTINSFEKADDNKQLQTHAKTEEEREREEENKPLLLLDKNK
jgi:hypothetical protein